MKQITKYEASGNTKAMPRMACISPAACRHILLSGYCTFQGAGKPFELNVHVVGWI